MSRLSLTAAYFLSSKHLDKQGQQRTKFRDINQELHFSQFLFSLITPDSKVGGRMGPFPLALLMTVHARKTICQKNLWDKQTNRQNIVTFIPFLP